MYTRTSSKADSSSSLRATATGAPAIPRAGGRAPAIADLMSARPRGAGRRPPAHTAPPRLRRNTCGCFQTHPSNAFGCAHCGEATCREDAGREGSVRARAPPRVELRACVAGTPGELQSEYLLPGPEPAVFRLWIVRRALAKECRPSSEDFLWEPPEGARPPRAGPDSGRRVEGAEGTCGGVRPRRPFSHSGTRPLRESGVKWVDGCAKRRCDRTLSCLAAFSVWKITDETHRGA